MTADGRRVARAWLRRVVGADVIELRPKRLAHPIKINGRDFARSTYGGPLGEMLGDDEEPSSGGARLIKVEPSDPWKFLWAYDTDRKYVAMWRVSDGSEKVGGPASTFTREILMLDKRGELNRVDRSTFDLIERFMHGQHDKALAGLKRMIEENASEEEKKLPALLTEYFNRTVVPEFRRRMQRWETGAHPLGFKLIPHSALGPKRQLASWTMSEVLKQFWTLDKAEKFLKSRGIALGLLGNQDVDFAMKDVYYEVSGDVLEPYRDDPPR